MTKSPGKARISLWYDHNAQEAAAFYAQTFPDTFVGTAQRAPGDYPNGKAGDVLVVEFTVMGIPCIGINGGPVFQHNEAFSFQVTTNDQAETDRYWNALTGNGGQESQCGWCKDKFGFNWQVCPADWEQWLNDPDPERVQRMTEAMYTMQKLDIQALRDAADGK